MESGLLCADGWNQESLGRHYGVSQVRIGQIIRGSK